MDVSEHTEISRINGNKSKGPKTIEGKLISSKNAVKHGIFSALTVIPNVESEELWKRHRTAFVDDLKPVGALEEMFVERIALLTWRLNRVARYEREMIHSENSKETNSYESKILDYHNYLQLIKGFHLLPLDSCLSSDDALSILYFIDHQESWTVLVANKATSWTTGLVWEGIQNKATQKNTTKENLLSAAVAEVEKQIAYYENLSKEREDKIAEARNKNLIVGFNIGMDKIIRYESHIEKALYKAINQLERIQSLRAGKSIPAPLVVDINIDNDNN